jgi:hypothetical protein
MAFLRGNEFGWFVLLIFYFILFAIISATTFHDSERRAVKGIAINLFTIMLPFMPLIGTTMYYEWLQRQYGSLVTTNLLIDYNLMLLHYDIAQVAGPLIFLLLLVVYVHKLYRRWWGLPIE